MVLPAVLPGDTVAREALLALIGVRPLTPSGAGGDAGLADPDGRLELIEAIRTEMKRLDAGLAMDPERQACEELLLHLAGKPELRAALLV